MTDRSGFEDVGRAPAEDGRPCWMVRMEFRSLLRRMPQRDLSDAYGGGIARKVTTR